MTHDIQILRELVQQYNEAMSDPVYDERRALWRDHHSLKPTRPPVIASMGFWNVWCREVFGNHNMQCEDPFYREYERTLRMWLFHHEVRDDWILEPWLTVGASQREPRGGWVGVWGLDVELHHSGVEGGAFKIARAPLQSWRDMEKMTWPRHEIDEEATARNVARLQEAVGDLITIDINRGPIMQGFLADISTSLAYLRGLEQLMLDMYESPRELHELLAFMRDGILENQRQAEAAGDFSLTCSHNQAMPYGGGLEDPVANSGTRQRRDLWGFFAAQEYTLISPKFHDEFLYQYQLPIMANYGLTHYGCCEDLTQKIDMLRQAPNLRSIAVTPVGDLAKSVAQIGTDYAISWRPNPTDMVCADFNEERIRRIIGEGLEAAKGTYLHIFLKDIETLQGENDRLRRWTEIVRSVIDEVW
ncbi:MAG: hypothetical protein KKI08_11630 [Armatimonadetes bacterium]|nr:hypothetical protein [Armatimonadota bacterium]